MISLRYWVLEQRLCVSFCPLFLWLPASLCPFQPAPQPAHSVNTRCGLFRKRYSTHSIASDNSPLFYRFWELSLYSLHVPHPLSGLRPRSPRHLSEATWTERRLGKDRHRRKTSCIDQLCTPSSHCSLFMLPRAIILVVMKIICAGWAFAK